jgi:hypothetical protein
MRRSMANTLFQLRCRYVASACRRGLTSQHLSARPSLAQPWQRGRLPRPAAVLRQPLLSCFSAVLPMHDAELARDLAMLDEYKAAEDDLYHSCEEA